MKTRQRPESFFTHANRVRLETKNPIKYVEDCEVEVAESNTVANHPLASSAGSFKNDPFWDEMMAFIEQNRRELAAEYAITE